MQHLEGEYKGEGGVRIWWQAWRPDAARAVLAIAHGLGEHSGRYGNVVEHVVPQGYAVYALDHRGHGRSGGTRGHIDRFTQYTADLHRMIELAREAEHGLPVFLLGHSLGGTIALQYALERPQGLAGLIVSSPALGQRFPVPAGKLLLARAMSHLAPAFCQHSGLPAAGLSHDPRVGAAYVADPLVHDLVSARFFTEMMASIQTILARAGEIKLPFLLLMSDDDPIVDSPAMRRLYESVAAADKTKREYVGFYHEGFNEIERARPLGDLLAWLDARVH